MSQILLISERGRGSKCCNLSVSENNGIVNIFLHSKLLKSKHAKTPN